MGSSRWFTIGLITSWYASNIGVLLLNKYLLSNYGFRYPIFLTLCHMLACSLLSYAAIAWLKVVPRQNVRSRAQFVKISVLSLVFCASVVSVLILVIFVIVWLKGEPSFHLFGFIICIAATAARALKSVLQGILLSSEGEKLNSMNLLMYMAPVAVAFLLPAALLMEENVVNITLALARDDVRILWYLIFNSALAYLVNLTNFLVTKHTSALTLQVLGNAKGAVAVVVSILIFRNPVSITGMLGYSLTLIGVVLYSEAKKRSK
ncbi:putative sugar phosphate/phosphate translocator [Vitis vinifera]|uniref:Putative sugar phosphate/phosphate translocator n=1 Tax=Vitis vinifera TaxID=29760 RepID=A0A438G157_VITVI|nr:putative sugar phosphate/phosphate translocator [Vitis vinifera]